MSGAALLHTREQFALVANAPLEVAWPLFGADRERVWAPDWNPFFIWPAKPFDREGMVFRVMHGNQSAVWVNTVFDLAAKRIQYVYVIAEVVVTVITLKLTPEGGSTNVEVTYERTALSHKANGSVEKMALRDRSAGKEWSEQINRHLSQQ